MFIQHINKGRLKEKVWEFYDSIPNPQHKEVLSTFIKNIYEDTKGSFGSNITKRNIQTLKGVPTQSNSVDCGMFVCKYIENFILQSKVDWEEYKNWQEEILKFMAKFAYAHFLTINK
ncbi:hypothetical protein IEQ34_005561 [Dendrobium chrysotoxum]|uniref:Ubiquitin-like protease family profile domain-containing protein n=1 Tax=Dendrobium chrysotoxum TaxID=161865 RepID=A0AAV7HD15_DENCH|nr:hypothetical protein IEQ34_005561 [Dendrobium chrysotoxum]